MCYAKAIQPMLDAFFDLVSGLSPKLQAEGGILINGPIHQKGFLQDQGDLTAICKIMEGIKRATVEEDLCMIRFQQTRQHKKECTFPATIWTDNRQHFASRYGERFDIQDNVSLTAHKHIGDLQQRVHPLPRCWIQVSVQLIKNVMISRSTLKAIACSNSPRLVSITIAVVSTRV